MKKLSYFLKAFLLFTITFCTALKPENITKQVKSLENQLEPTTKAEAAFNEENFLKELESVFEKRDQLKKDNLEKFMIVLQRAQVHTEIEYEKAEKIKDKLYKIQEEISEKEWSEKEKKVEEEWQQSLKRVDEEEEKRRIEDTKRIEEERKKDVQAIERAEDELVKEKEEEKQTKDLETIKREKERIVKEKPARKKRLVKEKVKTIKKENFIVQPGRLIEKNKKLSEKDKDQYFDLLIKIKENQKKLKRELVRSKLFSDKERFGPSRRTRSTLPPRTRLGKTIDPFFGEERGIRGRRSRPSLYERPSSGRPLDYLAKDKAVIGGKFMPKERPKI